jgi:hypothetical protein
MNIHSVKLMVVGMVGSVGVAMACDICATPVVSDAGAGSTSVSVFEQYSDYETGSKGESAFTSSTTQLSVHRRLHERWAVQVGLPWVDHELGDESESGLGDATALVLYRPILVKKEGRRVQVDLYGGVKMPTGDTDELQDERDAALAKQAATAEDAHGHAHAMGVRVAGHAGHDHGAEAAEAEHDESGHATGHHLSLGSGSWDGIVGVQGLWQQGRALGTGEFQYTLRTEGDYDFQYGDEWVGRLGAYWMALESASGSLAVGAEGSVESMDENEVLGVEQEGSSKDVAYVGPSLQGVLRDRLSGTLAWDIPVDGENEGVHGAADTRVRASLAVTF